VTLSDIASIGTLISGAAVTTSLIYVAIQTRQNVRHTRALIHQGTAARTTSALLAFMDEDKTAAWLEGNRVTPTPELIRKRQFFYHCATVMVSMEDHFSQHEGGLLSDEQFLRACEAFRNLMKEPGLKAYWKSRRDGQQKVAPRYCAFIDRLCEDDADIERQPVE
jgi:hypothetical protein